MAVSSKIARTWLSPKREPEARAPGTIVAKDTKQKVQALVVVGDLLVVTHHEGLARSPGGVTVRRLSDFKIVRKTKGSFGPVVPFGDAWLTHGPLWTGRWASATLLDPATLACRARFPVCGPFVARDAERFIASTPARDLVIADGGGVEPGAFEVDPALVAASWVKLPMPGGLVEIDVRRRTTELLVAQAAFDEFRHAALSPERDMLYAATGFGRTVAVRLSDRTVLWERPAVDNAVHWAGYAMALDPTGQFLATAGASKTGFDLLVFDTRTGRVETQLRLVAMINAARVAATVSARIEALAFHPSGWLAASTNTGVVAELQASGEVSAFRAATRAIDALAFFDDGASLVVGGAESNLRVWPVDLGGEPRVRVLTVDKPKAKQRTRVLTKR